MSCCPVECIAVKRFVICLESIKNAACPARALVVGSAIQPLSNVVMRCPLAKRCAASGCLAAINVNCFATRENVRRVMLS